MKTSKINQCKMSDDMILGVFDADGGILLNCEKKETSLGCKLDFSVYYYFGQSFSKEDLVEQFALKFDAEVKINKINGPYVKENPLKETGNNIREFLLKKNL